MSVESSRSLRQSIVKTLPIALACTSSLALPGLAQSAHVGRGTVHFCSDLKTQKIGSAQIGLPTRGAVVHSAHHVKGAGSGYCRVLGSIVSVDPAADPIRFEVNLPETWNGKAVQFGGGGFDGWLHQSDGQRYTPSLEIKPNQLRWPRGTQHLAATPGTTITICSCLMN